jgi:hypothetical protein
MRHGRSENQTHRRQRRQFSGPGSRSGTAGGLPQGGCDDGIVPGFERYAELLARLGKVKTGKVCLYIKKLADVDEAVLEDLIDASVAAMAPRRVDR